MGASLIGKDPKKARCYIGNAQERTPEARLTREPTKAKFVDFAFPDVGRTRSLRGRRASNLWADIALVWFGAKFGG